MKRAKKKESARADASHAVTMKKPARRFAQRAEAGLIDFATVRRTMRNTVAGKLFGFELEVLEPGRAVMTMRVRGRHLQLHGVVHGGLFAALADTAGALCAYPMLPRGTQLATIEMNIHYLEAVAGGSISAEARVVRLGRNFAVSECDIKDHKLRLVAKSLMTFAIRPPNQPAAAGQDSK
jgi:uncharacterized protein (TIGR00369 family)